MLSPEKILEIIKKIVNGHYTTSELEKLYKNSITNSYPTIEETAKNALIMTGLPEYKRKFVVPIKEKVKSSIHEIAEQHGWLNFPDNESENKIKLGGRVNQGEVIADYYFSYKQKGWKRALAFSALQKDVNSEIYYSIQSPGIQGCIQFQNVNDAIQLFKSELAELMA